MSQDHWELVLQVDKFIMFKTHVSLRSIVRIFTYCLYFFEKALARYHDVDDCPEPNDQLKRTIQFIYCSILSMKRLHTWGFLSLD